MPFPLVGAIAGLAKTFLPKLLPALGGLFGGAARAAPAVVPRALAPVARALPALKGGLVRALPTIRAGGRLAAGGAAFGAGSEAIQRLVPGGAKGIQIRIGRDGQAVAVRGRRMNPANVRALRRAIRRVKRFERMARRVGSFVGAGGYRLKGFRRRSRRGRWHRHRGDAPMWREQEPGLWQPYDLDEPEAYDYEYAEDGDEAEGGD